VSEIAKLLQEIVEDPPMNECADGGVTCVFCDAIWSQAKAQFTDEDPIVHESDCFILRAKKALADAKKT